MSIASPAAVSTVSSAVWKQCSIRTCANGKAHWGNGGDEEICHGTCKRILRPGRRRPAFRRVVIVMIELPAGKSAVHLNPAGTPAITIKLEPKTG